MRNTDPTGDVLTAQALADLLIIRGEEFKITKDEATQIVLKSPPKITRNVVRLSLPKRHAHLLHRLTADDNDKFVNRNGAPIPQAEIQFSIEGVGGLKSFQILGIKDLPDPYKDKVIFKIKELKHSITNTGWKTNVIAAIIPVKSAENIQ